MADRGPSSSPHPHPKNGSLSQDATALGSESAHSLPRHSSQARKSLESLHEASPLLSPRLSGEQSPVKTPSSPSEEIDDGDGQATKSVWYLILLTMSIGGLQIAWSVELSNGSPYLLSLGLSKSLMAFVWIAGPLSGSLVQPYVGIRSDNCRIAWGKRKPFMIGGGLATIISLLALSWTKEIVSGFLQLFGAEPLSRGVKNSTIVFAVFFVYILDFAINVVQAGIRAFIVDNAPTHQQEDANAWAGRMTGVGNVLGYLSGYIDLPSILPFLGHTQFQVLCVIACVALSSTITISSLFIRERDPLLEGPAPKGQAGVLAFFKQTFKSIGRLPPQVRKVCEVQFFAWIGWFPFLFYITTYIGEIYVEPIFAAHPDMSDRDVDRVWESATRVGTFALLIFAFTSFGSNILLPFIVARSYTVDAAISPSQPSINLTASMNSTSGQRKRWFSLTRINAALTNALSHLQIRSLTLRRAWLISHLIFVICMWSTLLVRTTTAATVLVGFVGLPWALTLWAPFALISAEISKRDAIRRGQLRAPALDSSTATFNNSINSGPSSHTPTTTADIEAALPSPNDIDSNAEDQAGIILGLHNVAIAAPQIIATLLSSIIFRLLQKPRGATGDQSVGWVLRLSAIATLVAAYMTSRVGEERDTLKGDYGKLTNPIGNYDEVDNGRDGSI
ncbi:MAG: hypothetical protein M1819_007131 [Sarea resinae]|nr:MAG: hypothetical protein M1819_007131 [Sarea resinae]